MNSDKQSMQKLINILTQSMKFTNFQNDAKKGAIRLRIHMCNIEISVSYVFIYSNLITTVEVSNIWFTYLQFYTVKITRN